MSFITAGKRDIDPASKRMPLSPASHAASVLQAKCAEAPKCKMVGDVKHNIATTGPQTAVSSSRAFETSLTVGSSYTFTPETGMVFSVTAGFDFIGKTEFTTTIQTSLAQAWEEDESKTTLERVLQGFTQELSQQPGTTAILTYIPQDVCDQGTAECGKDKDGKVIRVEDFKVCTADRHVDAGRYPVVYTSE
jgi:hypothetical protein